ncbi:MAG: type II toxin-antitoxin system prevent-host-death family antitoxin [Armatimonadota bacterium]
MYTLKSKDAKNKFGEMLDKVIKEPVGITKYDREVAVLVSKERYDELISIEDEKWADRARNAALNGFIGKDKTVDFIRDTMNADS